MRWPREISERLRSAQGGRGRARGVKGTGGKWCAQGVWMYELYRLKYLCEFTRIYSNLLEFTFLGGEDVRTQNLKFGRHEE